MRAKNNLLNQKFDRLLVITESEKRLNGGIAWVCRCDCGNEFITRSSALTNGVTTSCGCKRTEKFIDLHGKQFGTLTVLGLTESEFQIEKRKIWKCQCTCGTIVHRRGKSLTRDAYIYCGQPSCIDKKKPQKNLTGLKFGKLLVIQLEPVKRKRNTTWKCQCECGNITYVGTAELNSGHTETCGCSKANSLRMARAKRTENRKDPRIQLAKWVFKRHYNDDNLLFEEFLEMSQLNCHYCDTPPSNDLKYSGKKWTQEYKDASRFIYNGLDRVDSTKLHDKNNVVPCCKYCNFAKRHYPYDVFVDWIERVYQNLQQNGICADIESA